MPKGKSALKERFKINFGKPAKYIVFFHNDDVTTMDFVVYVLVNIFHKSLVDANHLMMKVHTEDKAPVGTYSYDIAMSKAEHATKLARENGYPLRITVEKDPHYDDLPF